VLGRQTKRNFTIVASPDGNGNLSWGGATVRVPSTRARQTDRERLEKGGNVEEHGPSRASVERFPVEGNRNPQCKGEKRIRGL